MNPWLTVLAAVVGVVGGSLSAFLATKAIFARYADRVFSDDVMKALEAETPRYRAFHERVFSSEMERGRRTADIAQGTFEKLDTHMKHFDAFRLQYDAHHEQIISIAQSNVHIAHSIDRFEKTVSKMGDEFGHLREEVASLRGRIE